MDQAYSRSQITCSRYRHVKCSQVKQRRRPACAMVIKVRIFYFTQLDARVPAGCPMLVRRGRVNMNAKNCKALRKGDLLGAIRNANMVLL